MSGTRYNLAPTVLALAFMTVALAAGRHLFEEKTVPLKGPDNTISAAQLDQALNGGNIAPHPTTAPH